jgi:hypothetical protein
MSVFSMTCLWADKRQIVFGYKDYFSNRAFTLLVVMCLMKSIVLYGAKCVEKWTGISVISKGVSHSVRVLCKPSVSHCSDIGL